MGRDESVRPGSRAGGALNASRSRRCEPLRDPPPAGEPTFGIGRRALHLVASLFATHSFASARNLCGHDALAQEVRCDRSRKIRELCRRGRSAQKERREGSRLRSPLRQCKHRRGRGGGPLTSMASLSASRPSRLRGETIRRPLRRARPFGAPIPAICGEIRGARWVSRTPETTSTAAITVAHGQRLAEQQRREAEPEDRHEQRERRDRPGRVRAQQVRPQAPADRRGRERDVGDRGDAAEVDPGQRVADPRAAPRRPATARAAAAAARRRSRS